MRIARIAAVIPESCQGRSKSRPSRGNRACARGKRRKVAAFRSGSSWMHDTSFRISLSALAWRGSSSQAWKSTRCSSDISPLSSAFVQAAASSTTVGVNLFWAVIEISSPLVDAQQIDAEGFHALAQGPEGLGHALIHPFERDPELLGDVLAGNTLNVGHDEHGAQVRTELFDRLHQPLVDFFGHRTLVGRGCLVGDFLHPLGAGDDLAFQAGAT